MRVPHLLLLLLFLSLTLPAFAQRAVVRGIVRATNDGEVLAGATVAVPALNLGTVTDEDGFYTLMLPQANTRCRPLTSALPPTPGRCA
ncbi:carboxypeptidase-like regulatory domain-containing protein [Pontibacter russatus]|uniref:carboxypeptidase-like regulatory domain-containing protein n=1 Tax=Pontibacter russatus TaxID=2694929 RepID=UPI001F171971|nr:carboxypeptidase-like regulatory domain-containing protein [Pontibacter russatus]